jgi:cytochrome c biogenesis protein CcmG, thiol:disulfide interchange protein DsbE
MKSLLFVLLGTLCFTTSAMAQDNYPIPNAEVQDLEGNTFQTEGLTNEGKPMIISFWATWCKPCIAELSAIHDQYEDLQDETGLKLVAVSIDDVRNVAKVAPFVYGRNWNYEIYCDPNGNFKRALSVNTVPHTFLVNGEGQIVWQHNSYNPGDEEELFDLVRKLASGEAIQGH